MIVVDPVREDEEVFKRYYQSFVQPWPMHSRKYQGQDWFMKQSPLTQNLAKQHLGGRLSVGTLGGWYPGYTVLDIDGRPMEDVLRLRGDLGLDDSNSTLCSSESPGHYHLMFQPEYSGRPPTLRLLQDVLGPFARRNRIEVYPADFHTIRLPFGPCQRSLDLNRVGLGWVDQTYCFFGLDPVALEQVPFEVPFSEPSFQVKNNYANLPRPGERESWYRRGERLHREGLSARGSRHDSQFAMLYYLWRQNWSIGPAICETELWIRRYHNGFSDSVNQESWKQIDRDIQGQAKWLWNTYAAEQEYPDKVRLQYEGWTTAADLLNIAEACDCDIRQCRFLYKLLKYTRPRLDFSDTVRVHVDILASFASKASYLTMLDRFQDRGILERSDGYRNGYRAKTIRWRLMPIPPGEPLLKDGSSPESFGEAVLAAFLPEVFLQRLRDRGLDALALRNLRRNLMNHGEENYGTYN